MKCDHCGVKRFACLMYNCTDLNICAFCSSDKLSSPNSRVSISKLSWNYRLFVKCSRASTYKQQSRKKWIASSITHPQTQPGSLIKFTLKRSAFKLLDLCLILVCRTFNNVQPYEQYLDGFNKLTSFISDFLKQLTVGALLISGVKLFQSLIEEGKNELRYNCNLVNGLL
jgi:hypothetical protein